ncbi:MULTISPECIES: CGNR zinc finger domain-containing protein [unclassified Nesterenkonia]|uniref:CGNR zinc finger domain-containing protein n=1 Tax=unclassified Nesterenkonia TaxID=2629769 RepID=UPI0021052873|nr:MULTISPECIES: CGNR zinc finger domain-containing protein [unclassified Nesterenkonia]
MAVLNSAPVIDGGLIDHLDGPSGREFARSWGGTSTGEELVQLRSARNALQSVIRGDQPSGIEELAGIVEAAVRTPRVTRDGVVWELEAPDDDRLAVGVVLAWSSVVEEFPGRLRACANSECNLFLVDHSRPGTARWCSMARCGNRMKARTHARRPKV